MKKCMVFSSIWTFWIKKWRVPTNLKKLEDNPWKTTSSEVRISMKNNGCLIQFFSIKFITTCICKRGVLNDEFGVSVSFYMYRDVRQAVSLIEYERMRKMMSLHGTRTTYFLLPEQCPKPVRLEGTTHFRSAAEYIIIDANSLE